MANYNEQSIEECINCVHVRNLPFGIIAKEITAVFEPFGTIIKLYLRRRIKKDSPILLSHPTVNLVFDNSDCVDQIMAARPFVIGNCQLFVRRLLPTNPKYSSEAFLTVRKILVRTKSENLDEILPDDKSIVEYLSAAGGNIEYFERLNNKSVLIQFDDYDPVDICCLSRPHYIGNQLIEIEKCSDENVARHCIEAQENTISPGENMDTISPIPVLSIEDQTNQLRSSYNDVTTRLEREHEQLIASLSIEWEQTAKERIRLQRLTLDYKQEHERLEKEARKWQKLYSDSLKEKPTIKTEGETKLSEAYQRQTIAKEQYNQLIENNQ